MMAQQALEALPSLSSKPAEVTIGRMLVNGARLYWFVEVDDDGTALGSAPTILGREALILQVAASYYPITQTHAGPEDLCVCVAGDAAGVPCCFFPHPTSRESGVGYVSLREALAFIAREKDA